MLNIKEFNNFNTVIDDMNKKVLLNNDIFSKQVYIANSDEVNVFLKQKNAFDNGISANSVYLTIDMFFEYLAKKLNVKNYTISRNTIWEIFEIIKENKIDSLKKYTNNGENIIKIYQVSDKIFELFKIYQKVSPEIFDAWSTGKLLTQNINEIWQMEIFNLLSNENKPVNFYNFILEKINKFDLLKTVDCSNFTFFNVIKFNEFQKNILLELAKIYDVNFYNIKNSAADKVNNFIKISTIIKHNFDEIFNNVAKIFISSPANDSSCFLNSIQNIFKTNENIEKLHIDKSFSIHNCYTIQRELEVLKNEILYFLDNNDAVLEDILILAPNIIKYQPYLKSVFENNINTNLDLKNNTKLTYSLSNQKLSQHNSLVKIFLEYLSILKGRFCNVEILDLLRYKEVHSSFLLTLDDVEIIEKWILLLNIKWGESGDEKPEKKLYNYDLNTWKNCINRLCYGYALGNDDFYINENSEKILPYKDIEADDFVILNKFTEYLTFIFESSNKIQTKKSLKDFSLLMLDFVDELFSNKSIEKQKVFELKTEIKKINNNYNFLFNFSFVDNLLLNLTEKENRLSFLNGGLNFANINNVNDIEFKMIAILGLDDSFPVNNNSYDFDIFQGEQNAFNQSNIENYNFYKLFLMAKDKLFLSYVGQDESQKNDKPESTVISSLLFEISNFTNIEKDKFIQKEALQSFDKKYFSADNKFLSYSNFDCNLAEQINFNNQCKPKDWVDKGLMIACDVENIEFKNVKNMFKNSIDFFIKNSLSLYMKTPDETTTTEVFSYDNLFKWKYETDFLTVIINNIINSEKEDFLSVLEKYKFKGELKGDFDELEKFQKIYKNINNIVKNILLDKNIPNLSSKLGAKQEDLNIDFNYNFENKSYKITGKISNQYEKENLIIARCQKNDGSKVINWYLEHLFTNIYLYHKKLKLKSTNVIFYDYKKNEYSDLIVFDTSIFEQNIPIKDFELYIKMYLQGTNLEINLFSKAMYSYVDFITKSKQKKMDGSDKKTRPAKNYLDDFPKYDESYKLIFNNHNPEDFITEKFKENSKNIYSKIYNIINKEE